MSTTTASRLPLSRLPAKSGKTVNGTLTQKTPSTIPSKLQKGSVVKSKLKPPSAGINKSPSNNNNNDTPSATQQTTSNTTQSKPSAATANVGQTTKLRSPIKTSIDTTIKASSIRSLLPSPKSATSTTSSSSIISDLKGSKRRSLLAQSTKQVTQSRRRSEDVPSRNARVAPLPDSQKSTSKIMANITSPLRKKSTTIVQQQQQKQQQLRTITTKKSMTSVPTATRKNENRGKLIAEVEKLRAENKKLSAVNKELMQEKGLLTADVCQMEHRLACEESRVLELEVDVAELRKQCNILNGKHDRLGRDSENYRSELGLANNLIMEQAVTMSDQQLLIEELMNQLDEQEKACQDLQSVIDNFKSRNNIFGDLKDINFALHVF